MELGMELETEPGRSMLSVRRRLRRRAYFVILPRGVGYAFGIGLARLAAAIRRREMGWARGNIAAALGDANAAEREALIRDAVDALGRNLVDTLTLERWLDTGRPPVADDGAMDTLRELRSRGRGVLILTGHIGCWELLGAWLARGLGGLAVVTGTIHNAPVDREVNSWRRRVGLRALPREGDLRPLLRVLKDGGVAAVLLDQNTRVHNVPVRFFGREAPTPVGPARLALRYGIPLLPVAIGREGDGHRVIHLPPLDPRDFAEGGEAALLTACNAALEELIRRNPAEWVWFHRRWD